MLSNGWVIAPGADPINHAAFLWQVYAEADPDYVGRATVPVLWNRRRETIVNNEWGSCSRRAAARVGLAFTRSLPPTPKAIGTQFAPAENGGLIFCAFGGRWDGGSNGPSVLPKAPEPIRRERRIALRAHDRTMTKIALDRPRILAVIGSL
jgi:hypothetical protein